METISKQQIRLTNFPIFSKKALKNHELVKSLYSQCLSYKDYKITLALLSDGKIELDNDIDTENLIHRIGKIVDIELTKIFENENNE